MAGIFNPEVKTLSNGLQIVVVRNDLAPIVSVGVLYKVGTADDPEHMVGISHFLEHLMFKGTVSVPGNEFKRTLLTHGGQINAMTGSDYTIYQDEIAVDHLDLVLKLEADRMVNLSFTEAEVQSERDVVVEERLMRLDNHPLGTIYESLLRAIYWYHPYGTPPIGYPHHIQNYTSAAVRQHYETWYAPNNAILIISGKVSLGDILPLVEKHFGLLKSHPLPERRRPMEPDHKGITMHIQQYNKRNSLVLASWYYQAPNHRDEKLKHLYYPLTVLGQLLGGDKTSPFYKTLVEDKKLALSVSSAYSGDELDPQPFSLSAELSPQMDMAVFKQALSDFLKNILTNGFSQKELDDAKRCLFAQIAFIRDGNENAVSVFSKLGTGFTVDEIENWKESIQAVTVEQVFEAAKTILGAPPIVTVEVHPEHHLEQKSGN
ncbi:MAG: pitrilysin family protein [Alphaproteobacteria bacterium]|nr:pitrilysin family protein [Alphaproteobacteria bacterium]